MTRPKHGCLVNWKSNESDVSTQILVFLNFWEYKQLEYWLKDNSPELTVRSLYDKFTAPEESDWYAIEGRIDVDTECILTLKYGDKIKNRTTKVTHG